MNRSSLLHIIERFETFLGKLPASIQKPVTQELTPLKELFLQQRPPRFVLTGANKLPVQEIITTLFAWAASAEARDVLMELYRWQPIDLNGHGMIDLLDARGAGSGTMSSIREELERQPADIFIHLAHETSLVRDPSQDVANLETLIGANGAARTTPKVIGILIHDEPRAGRVTRGGEDPTSKQTDIRSTLQETLQDKPRIGKHLVQIMEFTLQAKEVNSSGVHTDAQRFMMFLARELPNEARIEMVRIARDREAQIEIAQMLVKSTTAICTAIGAQPIPLADLPILTSLQLAMVSGIMYVSGRERSLRAATEFVGALGVNVGAGMLLREGTRAILKFFPGWGNVVCGVVAGAGTYAMGRAAIVYFIEGVSLKDARRTYLASRKKRTQRHTPLTERVESSR